jgi:tetratricopeptide (TPR) repeat protein
MEGDLEMAKDSYLRAVNRPRNRNEMVPAVLKLRLAKLALWSKDFQAAADLLEQVAKGRLDDETVNDALVWSLFLTAARRDSAALATFAGGDLHSFKGEHEQALAAFEEARTATKKGRLAEESLVRMAMELRALGRSGVAADSLREFLALYPTSLHREDVQFMWGDILERDLGDIPGAIEQYEQMLIEHPGGMKMEEVRRRIRRLEMYKQS